MNAPTAPLWRLLIACVPRPIRKAPFIRIPLYEAKERRQRNAILKDPMAAILSADTIAELDQAIYVLRRRGVDWRELVGEERAEELWARLSEELRDDGGPP